MNTHKANFTLRGRNPDILSCIANLSNDEVFTPPDLANRMLDSLGEAWANENDGANIWADKTVTFLDPSTKTGVFLREIASRLILGLTDEFPVLTERVDHILSRQVFGIGITQLTSLLARRSLYCSKFANGTHSVATSFQGLDGHVWFEPMEHLWVGNKCKFCNASKDNYDRGEDLESHAYAFIHTEDIKSRISKMFGENMQFDVIIGNPPYQLSDGGHGRSSSPIYHQFVTQAKKLEPHHVVMVIPARWYTGGKGLDGFRKEMLTDDRIQKLVDFENSSEVFSGVDIAGGICYFLWNRDNRSKCEVIDGLSQKSTPVIRSLDEFSIFVRQSGAVSIIRKILAAQENDGVCLSNVVAPSKPFGLRTFYEPRSRGIPCWFTQKLGRQFALKSDVKDSHHLLDKWKFLVPPAPIAGQTDFSKPIGFYYGGNTRIAKPGECCTESWLIAFSSDNEEEIRSFRSYLFTKTVRFLLAQTVVSQHVTRDNFKFIPHLEQYQGEYTDDILRDLWGITDKEWKLIDSKIKAVEVQDD